MMPPSCAECGADHHNLPADGDPDTDEFVLVQYGEPPRMPTGWVGHPAGAVWYCGRHSPLRPGAPAVDRDARIHTVLKARR